MGTREKQLGSTEPRLLPQATEPFTEGFLQRCGRFRSHAVGRDFQGPSAPFIAARPRHGPSERHPCAGGCRVARGPPHMMFSGGKSVVDHVAALDPC